MKPPLISFTAAQELKALPHSTLLHEVLSHVFFASFTVDLTHLRAQRNFSRAVERVGTVLAQVNSFIAISRKRIALVSFSLLSWNQSGRERVLSVRVSDAADWMADDNELWLMLLHWVSRAVRLVLYFNQCWSSYSFCHMMRLLVRRLV